jgi:hypothetical protein
MLRDALTKLPGAATWPCDEINYIWRHGNVRYPTDEFTPEMATGPIKRFIREKFDTIARRFEAKYIVEKTCANSLRVGFVDRVIPEAIYIHLVRDGRDVVASAMKRWTARLEPAYILAKARFVPISDLPYYAVRYLWNRAHQFFSREARQAFWGPRFSGMDEMLRNRTLAEVCAAQWAHSVRAATQAFQHIDQPRVLRVQYETFVSDPKKELARVLQFLGLQGACTETEGIVAAISSASVGKWQSDLDQATLALIQPIVEGPQRHYGYT